MKSFISLIVILIAALLVSGMGGMFGEDVPARIPVPDQNFVATVVDQADVQTKLTQFSIDGYTVFFGRLGKGDLAVPFDKIERADFRLSNSVLEVQLQLKGGKKLLISADKAKECYGLTEYGNFKITLGNIKMLTIHSQIVDKGKQAQ
ncbi:MAG: hypothetical protein V1742_06140 [Pseudomonadota bacterium]